MKGRFDIAFDITRTTVTATALNPCIDTGVPKSPPELSLSHGNTSSNTDSYAGYNNRWLMTPDGCLTISPFTVKSAIANGYRNFMGSCYRVISKVEGHPRNPGENTYYYNGKYKRYRVRMDRSKPGIVQEVLDIRDDQGKITHRQIVIEPVQERLYKKPGAFDPGEYYDARLKRGKSNVIDRVQDSKKALQKGEVRVIYHGPYQFGMDTQLDHGDLGCTNHHRFYEKKEGLRIISRLDLVNFLSPEDLKQKVYMGRFKPQRGDDPRWEHQGGVWHEDLSKLKKGDWVYYHEFSGHPDKIVENIGKNFQFKALFCHEDTVPDAFRPCTDVNCLCPGCRLFGMTGDTWIEPDTGKSHWPKGEVSALKGRFKAAALVAKDPLRKTSFTARIPNIHGSRDHLTGVDLYKWSSEKTKTADPPPAACQMLLPIQASPKPNKRDENGYFDPETGLIKGAKAYMDGPGHFADLALAGDYIQNKVDTDKSIKDDDFIYAHRLRNFAQVCDSGIEFSGVVGVENAGQDEVAALALLLETGLGEHAYKLGLGKALGMGTVVSRINTIWIRSPEAYTWQHFEIRRSPETKDGNSLSQAPLDTNDQTVERLKQVLKAHTGVDKELELLSRVSREVRTQLQTSPDTPLTYPEPKKYWKTVQKTSGDLTIDLAGIRRRTDAELEKQK